MLLFGAIRDQAQEIFGQDAPTTLAETILGLLKN